MIRNLLLTLAIIVPMALFSQEQSNNTNGYKYGIGAAAGFSTGYGLSFRYWPSDWGLQLTTAPYYTESNSTISIGATALRTIKNDGRIKLFGYIGNHLFFERYSDYWYEYPEDGNISKYRTWIIGAGPGFEFIIANKVSFNLMFGVASYTEFNSNDRENHWMLNMTAETGLYYRF